MRELCAVVCDDETLVHTGGSSVEAAAAAAAKAMLKCFVQVDRARARMTGAGTAAQGKSPLH
jgi:hypothetical protein